MRHLTGRPTQAVCQRVFRFRGLHKVYSHVSASRSPALTTTGPSQRTAPHPSVNTSTEYSFQALTAFYGPRDLTQDRCASTPPTARPSHNGGHHHARPQRRVPTSRMLSSIFLKMLRGGSAPSGYRPSNDQPTASRDLHTHLDMLLTTADLIRSAHAKASRFPMTFAAPRFTSETPTSARRSSIQMACFPSTTAVFARAQKRKEIRKNRCRIADSDNR